MFPTERTVTVAAFVLCFSLVALCSSEYPIKLSGPEKSSKILMLLSFASESHRNCFLPLAQALADRGHKVTILSPLPPKANHANITEVKHAANLSPSRGQDASSFSMFKMRERIRDPILLSNFVMALPKVAKEMYETSEVQELYKKRKEFDLIIANELFNEGGYPFLEGQKYVTLSTSGVYPSASAALGNVLSPAYFPSLLREYPRPFSFWSRVKNLFTQIVIVLHWNHRVVPAVEKELSNRFPTLAPLKEIEKGKILELSNSYFPMDIVTPLLPSQVEVGGMHCRPGKPLPQDLKDFLDNSGDEGVIYFSLGSICKGSTIPEQYKDILLKAFGKMKQKVIWKFEADFEGLPKNIMIKSWLPQQDILAHPNVKLFITHGGLLSQQESIYHGKPTLALPVFGDQLRNSQRMENKGFGKLLVWEEMTVDSLVDTMKEIIYNPKYRETVERASIYVKDQPMRPVDRAVWWIEYVIRHKGAPQLRSPAADLSWIEYLMLDVVIALHILLYLVYIIVKNFVCFLFCSSKSKQDMTKKRQ